MELVDSLEAYFPAGSPVVHLLKAPAAFLETEGSHLKDGGVFQEGSEVIGVRFIPPRGSYQAADYVA